MGYPAKFNNTVALLRKKETGYGVQATPAATDAVLLALSDRYAGIPTFDYLFDGKLGPAPGNFGSLPNVPTQGRRIYCQTPQRAKGFGAAYSASNLPNVHVGLCISGFDPTIVTTPGTEKVTYALTPDGATYAAATDEYYRRGEKYISIGTLADLEIQADTLGPPLWIFSTRGIGSVAVTDAALPTATYPTLSVIEPSAAGSTIVLGSLLTAVVRKWGFKLNRTFSERANQNGSGEFQGWVPTGINAELRATIEATAFVGTPFHTSGGIDSRKLREAANVLAVSMQVAPTVQYTRYKLSAPTAQCSDVAESNDGGVATVDLTFQCNSSTPILYDGISVVFD